jgi:hypothetical protein
MTDYYYYYYYYYYYPNAGYLQLYTRSSVSKVYNVASTLWLHFVENVMLFPVKKNCNSTLEFSEVCAHCQYSCIF